MTTTSSGAVDDVRAPGGRRRPGSQSALRGQNRRRIVDTLATSGPLSQAELSRRTGLSAATVSNLVRLLVDDGAVVAEQGMSSGRRATSVRLCDDGSVVAGFDFGRRHARVVLVSPGYRVLGERAIELPLGYPALEGVDAASRALDDLLDERGLGRAAVLGAGLGLPGPIDRRSHTVVLGAILPEWIGVTAGELEDHLGMSILLDNDANLGALAQVTWGEHADADSLVFVKIGSGIGSGLILGGRPHYGHIGVTGEIGHTTIDENGDVCQCGNRGCLETVASTTRMLELLSRSSPAIASTADIVASALAGDPGTLRVLDDAGGAIGSALGTVANLVNPSVIVIGGPLVELGDLLVTPIRRSLGRHSVPSIAESTEITISSLGDRAEALGAASLALRAFHTSAPPGGGQS